MKQVSLSESELRRRRAWLARLAEEHPGQSATDPDLPAEIRAAFSLSEEAGAAFYGSLSDEDLLDVLRRRAEELGRSPAQKEIYWVWRAYLRQRFGKWPYALTAAGLSKSAGSGGSGRHCSPRCAGPPPSWAGCPTPRICPRSARACAGSTPPGPTCWPPRAWSACAPSTP